MTPAELIAAALQAGQSAVDSNTGANVRPNPAAGISGQSITVTPPTATSNIAVQSNPNTDPVAALKQGIIGTESGGNYKAKSKSSTASGIAQWLDGTWNRYGGYQRAADAPPEVQDKRLHDDLSRLNSKYGGDPTLVALAWIGGEGAANRLQKGDTSVLTKKDANGFSYGDYVNRVKSKMGTLGSTPTGAPTSMPAKGLASDTQTVFSDAFKTFGTLPYGGVAHRNINGTHTLSDHATGHAVDLTVPPKSAQGDQIANWAIQQPNVKYVIWNNQFASPKTNWKWEPYAKHGPAANQASATGRHEDHVHISTVDMPATK